MYNLQPSIMSSITGLHGYVYFLSTVWSLRIFEVNDDFQPSVSFVDSAAYTFPPKPLQDMMDMPLDPTIALILLSKFFIALTF